MKIIKRYADMNDSIHTMGRYSTVQYGGRLASCSSSILIDAPHAPDGDVLDRVAYVVAETTIDLRIIPVDFYNSTLSIHLYCCMTLGAGCLNIISKSTREIACLL
jgi:hypothetical protein